MLQCPGSSPTCLLEADKFVLSSMTDKLLCTELPLPRGSEQVCLASSDFLHMHLDLAGMRFGFFIIVVFPELPAM